jgi:alkylation response protein AidB-like acyl-CoA dehydrogenase
MDEQQQRLAEELLFSGVNRESFAKSLYFSLFDANKVLPYPEISSEESDKERLFLHQLDNFIEEELDPIWIDQHGVIPEHVIHGLGKIGLLGITIPPAYNGLGMPQHSYCKAMELLAKRCCSTALFVNAHQSVGLKALLLFGTEEQKRRWLPKLATGEQIAAFSLTEPNAGSDASAVETKAVYDPDKKIYRINGRKQWTTNGSIASVLTVMAKTEIPTKEGIEEKITAFLVTPDMPGFKVTAARLDKAGMRGSTTSNLSFENLEVPEENILGPIGGGLKVCLTVLDYGRTTFGATCTGTAKQLLEKAIHRARTRIQFKQPLGKFGLVKQKLATMSALCYAMDATTYLTAGIVDANRHDFMLEAAMLKVFASDSLWTIVYETMQIFGGKCYFTDEPLERIMRDARINMIGEGANEVLRVFIALVGMREVGTQLKKISDASANPIANRSLLLRFAKHCLCYVSNPKLTLNSPELAKEAAMLSSGVRKFGLAIIRLLKYYRESIVDQQLELNRIATAAISLYTTTAVLSKINSDLVNKKAEPNDLPTAKLYCRLAKETFDNSLEKLFDPLDKEIEDLSDRITALTN